MEHLLHGNIYTSSDSYESEGESTFDKKKGDDSFPDVHNQEDPYTPAPNTISDMYESIPDRNSAENTYDTIPALQNNTDKD